MLHPTYAAFHNGGKHPIALRQAFGAMLQNWRRRCGWTQYTYCDWARHTSNKDSAISYGNLSVIEQGKAGELRQKVFWQLWEMNRRIAHQDWGDPLLIKDQLLKKRLKQAVPLGDDDCPLWGPAEFWSCYNGLLPVPCHLKEAVPPAMSQKQLKAFHSKLRDFFAEAASAHTDPIDCLDALRERAPVEHAKAFAAVLAGLIDYTPSELEALWDPQSNCFLPELWLTA